MDNADVFIDSGEPDPFLVYCCCEEREGEPCVWYYPTLTEPKVNGRPLLAEKPMEARRQKNPGTHRREPPQKQKAVKFSFDGFASRTWLERMGFRGSLIASTTEVLRCPSLIRNSCCIKIETSHKIIRDSPTICMIFSRNTISIYLPANTSKPHVLLNCG
jgi:hypothetical protein